MSGHLTTVDSDPKQNVVNSPLLPIFAQYVMINVLNQLKGTRGEERGEEEEEEEGGGRERGEEGRGERREEEGRGKRKRRERK